MRTVRAFVFTLIVMTFSCMSHADIVCRTDSDSLSEELIIKQLPTGEYRAEILNRLIVSNLRKQAEQFNEIKLDNKDCHIKVLRNGILRMDKLADQHPNFSSGSHCPFIQDEDQGLRVIFPYFRVTSSGRPQIFEIANWKFNDCR